MPGATSWAATVASGNDDDCDDDDADVIVNAKVKRRRG
jgi:hypothetical protein